MSVPNAEQAVRDVIADFSSAIHDRDAPRLIGLLTPDATDFDLAPPLAQGPATTRDPAHHEAWFVTWDGPIVSRDAGLTVRVDGDVAYAFGLRRLTGRKTDGTDVDLTFRATACLTRADGRWRIHHMHNSVPFAMDGSGRALLDLKA